MSDFFKETQKWCINNLIQFAHIGLCQKQQLQLS